MKFKLTKDSYLHSKDYFELLSSINYKPLIKKNKLKPFYKTKDGVVVNPNYTSEMYEKLNNNTIYIKCCCIRFLHNNMILIVNGENHSGSVKNCKDILGISIVEYERGFLLSNMSFISCEEAPSFIKSYKLEKSNILKKENYTCIIDNTNIIFLKNDQQIMNGKIIKQKTTKNKYQFLIEVSFYLYDNICKKLYFSLNTKTSKAKLCELNKTFKFSKRKNALFDIIEIIESA